MFKTAIIVGLGLKIGFIIGNRIDSYLKLGRGVIGKIIIRKAEKSDKDYWQDAYETVMEKPHPVRMKEARAYYRNHSKRTIGFKVED